MDEHRYRTQNRTKSGCRVIHIFITVLLTLSVFGATAGIASAQVTVDWSRTYDGGGIDIARGTATDAFGNVIVFGQVTNTNFDFYTIKYDKNGNELWNKTYDSSSSDYGRAVSVDKGNNIIVTGDNSSFYETVKYNSSGVFQWDAVYNSGTLDISNSVATDSQGNVILAGRSSNNYYTIKYDKNGNELWNTSFTGGSTDVANGVAVDSDDNIIVTGYVTGVSENFYTIKYDKDGNELWNATYDGGGDDNARGVAVDKDDNVIVTGKSGSTLFTIKYDKYGNELWNTSYSGGEAYGVAVNSNRDIYVTGFKTGSDKDYITIKYDKNGNELWNTSYDGGDDDEAYAVAAYPGYVVVTGYSFGTNKDFHTIKYLDKNITTVYVPDDYAKIQWAVGNVSDDDIIIVRDGTYYENVIVDKSVTIRSENGKDNCEVNGGGLGSVFTLEATGIELQGFKITNSGTSGDDAGVKVNSSGINIKNNNITSNHFGVLLNFASIVKNNDIVDNDFGLVNQGSTTADAEDNWWGDISGPSGEGCGVGDSVSTKVDYSPWLDSSDGAGISFTGCKKQVVSGDAEVDGKNETDVSVDVENAVNVEVNIGLYSRNPTGFATETGKYFDVNINNSNLDELEIRAYYTDGEISGLNESLLRMFWWNGTAWEMCSATGVNITGMSGYSGYIWALINDSTIPTLDDITGSIFSGSTINFSSNITINEVYLKPQNSSAEYCTNAEVEIWAKASNLGAGQINLTYNSSCANVTSWVMNSSFFGIGGWNSLTDGREWITFATNKSLAGEFMIGTLKIHCVTDTPGICNTPLYFYTDSKLFDPYGNELNTTWKDGAFQCSKFACGDVNCNAIINMGDVIALLNNVTYSQPICNTWAGDVNCDGDIDMGDVVLLLNNVTYVSGFPLNCCSI